MPTMNAERRLELDAVLKCPCCGGVPYRLFRRQNQQADGELLPTFQTVLWPVHPDVAPPLRPECICCPHCGDELRRVAP